MKEIRAIVPAAGKGKRLQKLSGDMPKAMFPVGGRSMLEIVLENLNFIEDKNIYIVVGYGKEVIMDRFGERYHYAEQKEQLGIVSRHYSFRCHSRGREMPISQVKKVAVAILLHIRGYTQKAGQLEQEDKVKVGIPLFSDIEPLERVFYIKV